MESLVTIFDTFAAILGVVLTFWWIYTPILLWFLFLNLLESYNRHKYISGLKWVLLEVRFPPDAHRSLKAMEQVFASFHTIPPIPVRRKDALLKGKVPDWLTLEIVSISGDIKFFVRTLESYRNYIEAQLYGQFPEVEIEQAEDYLTNLPAHLPTEGYDLTGAELGLIKEDAYPIRTYYEFEEQGSGLGDVKRIDPLASLAEFFSTLSSGEYAAIQYNISATGGDWVKKGQAVIDKLMGKAPKPEATFADQLFNGISFLLGIIPGLGGGEEKKEEKKEEGKKFADLSPGTQNIIKAIEVSFAKLAFNTGIRFIYIAPKEQFNLGRFTGMMGPFKQFASAALNGFKPVFSTFAAGIFKKRKEFNNKILLFDRFKNRSFPENPFVLTIEELATVFHFPDVGVKTRALPRIEAKKGEPPANLPVS